MAVLAPATTELVLCPAVRLKWRVRTYVTRSDIPAKMALKFRFRRNMLIKLRGGFCPRTGRGNWFGERVILPRLEAGLCLYDMTWIPRPVQLKLL